MNINKTAANSTSLNNVEITPSYMYVYVAAFCFAAFLGTLGNIGVIVSMFLNKKLRTMRNAFIVSLGASDLLVCTVSMPATLLGVLNGKQWNEEQVLWCHLTSIICGPACMVSMYSCTMIAVSRYFYIGRYQVYLVYFTSKKILLYVCIIWLLCVIICLPNHFGWGDVKFSPVLYFCWLDTSTYSYLAFYTIIKIIAIIITFVFYIKIYMTVRKSSLSKLMITGKRQRENATENDHQHKGLSEQKISEELKIIKVTFKIFALFAVCWTPLIILFLLTAVYSGPQWLYLCASFLGHSNSTLNFILYFLDNNLFRSALMKCLKRKIYNISVSHITHTAAASHTAVAVN